MLEAKDWTALQKLLKGCDTDQLSMVAAMLEDQRKTAAAAEMARLDEEERTTLEAFRVRRRELRRVVGYAHRGRTRTKDQSSG